jgi:diaminopropionate ammonia-lyase
MNPLLTDFAKYQLDILANSSLGLDATLHQAPLSILSQQQCAEAIATIQAWDGYQPTPLHSLSGLSQQVGVGQIWCKDEFSRFGLGSFKALGGAYAVYRQLVRLIQQQTGQSATFFDLQIGKYHEIVSHVTVTTATDGNHGRSVAWGAKQFGCQCVIYLHEQVTKERAAQIAAYDARIVRVAGSYDDSVRQSACDAERNHWLLIADTSYLGYVDVPCDVMQGYTVMIEEVIEQLPFHLQPSHVFVQAGVGSLAAAVFGYLCQRWVKPPLFIVVEPEQAACLYTSNRQGKLATLSGDLNTFMACLSAGVPSLVAWQILQQVANFFLTIPDEAALRCMRLLAHGVDGDPVVVAGESGCAGVAALLTVLAHPNIAQQLELDNNSSILLFNTEGATDPTIYQKVLKASDSSLKQITSLK